MTRRALGILIGALLALSLSGVANAHWPVASRYAHISQWYSARHRAIDIAAPCGTRIYSPVDGRVVWAGWESGGGGWAVDIRAFDGRYIGLHHMKYRPRVSAGQRVYYNRSAASGTVVGYIGSTGNSTGCHTHVEAWVGYPWRSGSYRISPWSYINHGYWFRR